MKGGRQGQQGLEPRECIICAARFQPYRDFHVTCGERSCREDARGMNPRTSERQLTCKVCAAVFTALWSGIGKPPPCPECAEKSRLAKQERQNVARRVSTNPERAAVNRNWNLRVVYGVTAGFVDAKIAAQENRCMICGASPKPDGIRAASRLHLDHDHKTGQIRDLLCNNCNRGLGGFKDDPVLLRAAAAYIERHRRSM